VAARRNRTEVARRRGPHETIDTIAPNRGGTTMNDSTLTRYSPRISRWALLAATIVAWLLGMGQAALAADPPGGKAMHKDIRSMERVIDDMLVDSPNFLVDGNKNARGIYEPGRGVVFTFDASLVSRYWGHKGNGWRFWRSDDDVYWDWDDEYWDEDEDDDSNKSDDKKGRSMSSRGLRNEEKIYKRGQDEMVDLLLEYSDRLDGLKAGESVTLIAYLRDARYFRKNKISNFLVRASIDDLRAYADDRLSEEQMVAKVVREEY
jgi:hypothetical protein